MKQKTYLRWGSDHYRRGLAPFSCFTNTSFQDGVLFIFIEKLFGHPSSPCFTALQMAYLLTPIVDFFDRLLRDRLGVKRARS